MFSLVNRFTYNVDYYQKRIEMYRKSVDSTELLVKSTKKSSCKNKYRTSSKIYIYPSILKIIINSWKKFKIFVIEAEP